jgi:hypothetical protein
MHVTNNRCNRPRTTRPESLWAVRQQIKISVLCDVCVETRRAGPSLGSLCHPLTEKLYTILLYKQAKYCSKRKTQCRERTSSCNGRYDRQQIHAIALVTRTVLCFNHMILAWRNAVASRPASLFGPTHIAAGFGP